METYLFWLLTSRWNLYLPSEGPCPLSDEAQGRFRQYQEVVIMLCLLAVKQTNNANANLLACSRLFPTRMTDGFLSNFPRTHTKVNITGACNSTVLPQTTGTLNHPQTVRKWLFLELDISFTSEENNPELIPKQCGLSACLSRSWTTLLGVCSWTHGSVCVCERAGPCRVFLAREEEKWPQLRRYFLLWWVIRSFRFVVASYPGSDIWFG